MELSSSNIKKLFIFSQKKAFLIFSYIFLYFRKRKPQKNPYISGHRTPKKLLIF